MAQNLNGQTTSPAKNIVKVNVLRANVKQTKVIDTDIVFVLEDGRTVFIRDGAVQSLLDNGFSVEFSDGGQVSGQELLQSAGAAEISSVALTGPQASSNDGVIVAQAPQAIGTSPVAQPSSGGGLRTWLAVGTPLVGGVLGGVLGGGGSSTTADTGTPSNVKPATPVINVISDNDQINAADKARGVEIRGSGEASASVTVIWGTISKTATADASGLWSVTYATSEVPADALGTTVSATIKSSAGVSSDPASRTVQIDTKLPDAPVIANVADDNVVGPSEKTNGVEVSGTAEANSSVELTWGTVTKIAQADRIGSWKAQFLAGEVPPTGSSNVSAKATDAFGNVSNAASASVVISPAVTITGQISAGPLQAGHGLTVDLYLGNGTLLVAGIKPGSDGVFTVSGLPVGVGDVVIARVNDTTSAGDYLDEATGLLKDLNAVLMATKAIGSVNETLNITPITTIAAIKAGLASDGSGTIANAAAATNANAATASALGLGGIDIAATRAITTESAMYNPTNGLDDGEKVGAILAALSGADKANGGDAQATINALSQLVTATGATGTLLPQGQVTLMQGAAEAENAVPGNLQNLISDTVAAAVPSPRVVINTVASDNIITATELSALVVSGTVTSGASAVSVAFGTRTVAAELTGTSWTYTATTADIAALGADGAKLLQATATFADNSTAGASRLVSLKATPPALPDFTRIAGDTENYAVNKSEKTEGFTVQGTGDPGTTVFVTLGLVTKSRDVANNGTWSVTFEGLEIPAADGNYEVSARAKDVFGNETAPVTRNVLIDTQAPTLLTFNQVTGDNRIGPGDVAATRFEGTAEAGALINVVFDGNTYSGRASGVGAWSISLPASRIPTDSTYEAVATVFDAAGNPGVTVRQSVTVDVSPPGLPSIDQVAGDDFINKAERDSSQGVIVSGKAEAGTLIEMSWAGKSYTPIRANSRGSWSFNLTAANSEIPVDSVGVISVTSVDTSGNRSLTATRTVTVDTVSQGVVINSVSQDNRINLADKNGNFTVEGVAENSAFMTVTVGGMTETTNAAVLDGKWSVTFTPSKYLSDFPLDATNLVVSATARDIAGNVSLPATKTVEVDTVRPDKPSIEVVAGDDAINAVEGGSSITIRGRAEANSKVTIDWGSRVVGQIRDVDANGDWSIIVSRANIPDEGSADVIVRAADAAGNVSDPETRRVTIDLSTDIARIDPVGGEDNIVNNAERDAGISITGFAEANGRVEVRIGTQTVNANVNDQGYWRADFLTGQLPGDGVQTVFVRSFDKAGNEAETVAQLGFTVDLSSPAPEFTGTITPAGAIRPADDIVNAAERNVGMTVRGRGEVGGRAFVTFGPRILDAPVEADGTWTITFPRDGLPTGYVGKIFVYVRDAAGNISPTSEKPLIIDANAPAKPTISTVAGDNVVNKTERENPNGVDVSGKAEAGARVFVRWGPGGVLKETDADSNGDWTVNFLGTQMNASGATQIIAYQADVAGNIGAEETLSITVATGTPVAPDIGLTILGGDNIVNSTEYAATPGMVISGTAVAGNKVRLSWGNVTNLEADVGVDGAWSYTISGNTVTNLFDTTTTISVRQIDPDGNESPVATRSITIDRTAPIGAAITSQSGTDQANDRTLNAAERDNGLLLSGTAASDAQKVRISYTANGLPKSFDAAVVNGAWTYSIGKDDLPADTLNGVVFSVSPIDLAGNVGNATPFTYNFDLTPPTAPSAITFGGSDNVISILEADVNSPSTPIVVGGALSAGHGASKVVVTWTFGGNTYSQEAAVLASATSWSLNWNKVNLPSSDGSYVVNAYTVDAAGNASASVPVNLSIVRAIPATLSFTSITANSDNVINIAEAAATTLNVSGTGGTEGATVFLTLGTSSTPVGSATVLPNGSWTIDLAKANYPTVDTNFNVYQVLPNSNRGPIVSQQVTLDLSAPQNPTITAPTGADFANDAFMNAGELPNGLFLQGTAAGASRVVLTWMVGATPHEQSVSVSGGQWSYTIDAARLPNGNPVTTTTAFSARSFDAAGNPSVGVAQQSYTFDTLAPATATGVTFAGDNVVNASEAGAATLNFTGSLGNNHGAKKIVIVWNGRTETLDVPSASLPLPNWVVPWSNAYLPSTASSTAQVFIEDAAGNRTLVERIITNNRTLPNPLTNIVVAQDNIINFAESQASSISITGEGSAPTGLSVFVTLGGVTVQASSIDADGKWVATVPTAGLNFAAGNLTVSAYQRNAVGSDSVPTTPQTILVDTAPPAVLTINDVAGDNRINLAESTGSILLQGTTDAGATVSVTWGLTTRNAVVTTTGGVTTWQASFLATERPPLTDGISTSFNVVARDTAGNTKSLAKSVDVDLSPPTSLTVNLSGGDDRLNSAEVGAGVTISGQADPNAPITVNWGGRIQTATAGGGGDWSVLYSADRASPVGVPNDGGSVTLTVSQLDQAGNQQTINRPILIDTSAPSLPSILAMSNDYGTLGDWTTDRNAVVLVGTAEANARVELSLNGTSLGTANVDASGVWQSNVSLTSIGFGGSGQVTVRTLDLAGNASSQTATQTIYKAVVGSSAANQFNLSQVTASTGFVLAGATGAESFGSAVTMGDVNGDGFMDFIIGAIGADAPGVSDGGDVTVVLGRQNWSPLLSNWTAGGTSLMSIDLASLGTNGYSLKGAQNNGWVGQSVAFLGDINNDGIGDFAGGAPAEENGAILNPGAVYVMFGRSTLPSTVASNRHIISTNDLTAGSGFIIRSSQSNAQIGLRLTSVGDMNGDGIADMVVASHLYDRPAGPGQTGLGDAGVAAVIFGRADGNYGTLVNGRREIDIDTLSTAQGFLIRSAGNTSDNLGYSVASAGDVNGDGRPDLIVSSYLATPPGGASGAGVAYVIYGRADGNWTGMFDDPAVPGRKILNPLALAPADGFAIYGEPQANGRFGTTVSSAGDFNGDGYADLLIGAGLVDSGGKTDNGAAYVVFGGPSPGAVADGIRSISMGALTPAQGFIIRGLNANDQLGTSLQAVGDVNGDGISDIRVTSINQAFGAFANAGYSYILFGKPNMGDGWGQIVNGQSVLDLANFGPGDGMIAFGLSETNGVAGFSSNGTAAGDLNGDGVGDLYIGSGSVNALGRGDNGLVWVYYGSNSFGGLNLTGTTGADYLLGSALGDSIAGGANDLLFGLAGNDVLSVTVTNFARVDGGTGTDMLRLSGAAGLNINLSTLAAGAIQGIEQIDLVAGSLNNTLTITQQSLLDISNTSDRLTVLGDSGDTVTAAGFTTGLSLTENGITYDIYTSGAAALWVQSGINFVGATPPSPGYVLTGFAGNETLTIGDTSFSRVDGGAGTDTLRLAGTTGFSLNLTTLAAGAIQGIERIDLVAGSLNNTLTVTEQTLRNLSTTTDLLQVLGDSGDTVNATGFLTGGSVLENGINYTVYTRGAATLWVQQGVTVAGAVPPPVITAMSNDYGTVGDWTTDRNSVLLVGTAQANAQVELFLNGTSIGTANVDALGIWQSTISLANVAFGSSVSVTARTIDLAGNVGSQTSGQTINKASIGITPANTIDLLAVPAAQTLLVVGATHSTESGSSLSFGDVNNDGVRDMIIGTYRAAGNDGASRAGEATVVYGRTSYSGVTLIGQANLGTDGYTIRSNGANTQFGTVTAFFGDINGDGVGDWAAGNHAISYNGITYSGGIWVNFGSSAATPPGSLVGGRYVTDTLSIGTATGFVVRAEAGEYIGAATVGAGDLNGDGIADMVFGTPFFDRAAGTGQTSAVDTGMAMVLFGRANNLYLPGSYANDFTGIREVTPTKLTGADGFLIRGVNANDYAGISVSSAGDVNADGIADLIIGAYGVDRGVNNEAGAAYVVYGKASGGWGGLIDDPALPGRKILDLANLQSADGFRIIGPTTGSRFGWNVSGVGDVNADGFADIAIGTIADSAYIVFGSATGQGTVTSGIRTLDATTLTATQGFRMNGPTSFGQFTGPAGDVNGDGIADIMISAAFNTSQGRSQNGEVYIVFGKAAGTGGFGQLVSGGQVLSTTNFGAGDGFVVQGRGSPDRTGNMLSFNGYMAAGDINRDGIDDVAIPIYSGDIIFGDNGNITFLYGATGRGGLSLTGTSGANTLVGGDLNDTIIGGGGADILLGLIGNDILTVADANFSRVDGGAGTDTLRMAGSTGFGLNLSTLAAGAIQGIEQIDLVAGSLNNTLTVTQQTLLDLSSTSNRLTVLGDLNDTVNAAGFTAGAQNQNVNGILYDTYTNGLAELWVQDGVVVNTPAQSGFVAPAISWADQAVLAA